MPVDQEARLQHTSKLLVRIWFGAVAVTAFVLLVLLMSDYFRGEAISHLGLGFMLTMATLALVSVSVVLLPLLVIAVVLRRKART